MGAELTASDTGRVRRTDVVPSLIRRLSFALFVELTLGRWALVGLPSVGILSPPVLLIVLLDVWLANPLRAVLPRVTFLRAVLPLVTVLRAVRSLVVLHQDVLSLEAPCPVLLHHVAISSMALLDLFITLMTMLFSTALLPIRLWPMVRLVYVLQLMACLAAALQTTRRLSAAMQPVAPLSTRQEDYPLFRTHLSDSLPRAGLSTVVALPDLVSRGAPVLASRPGVVTSIPLSDELRSLAVPRAVLLGAASHDDLSRVALVSVVLPQ